MATEAEFIRNQLRITCADALELMTEFLDRALSPTDQERFRAHLGGCEACAVYLDQLRLTVDITGTLGDQNEYQVNESTMEQLVDIYRSSRDES